METQMETERMVPPLVQKIFEQNFLSKLSLRDPLRAPNFLREIFFFQMETQMETEWEGSPLCIKKIFDEFFK